VSGLCECPEATEMGRLSRASGAILEDMPRLLEESVGSQAMPYQGLGRVPAKGVYLFSEGRKHLYVGRSDNLRRRIKEHGRPSSGHTTAPFAFNLARSRAQGKPGYDPALSRSQLADHPCFRPLFMRAKGRVRRMSVRVVDVDDPVRQALLELYAAVSLRTPYNSFGTH